MSWATTGVTARFTCRCVPGLTESGSVNPRRGGTCSSTGSGTIANEDVSLGASCLAEIRMLEIIADGKPSTPFMSFGDTIRIEMLDRQGASIFGAIEQVIEAHVK
jgi:fumarylacetoacetate (FAA) hydrolase